MEIKDKNAQDRNKKWSTDYFKKPSTLHDVVDDIYSERDPICASLKHRKKEGHVTAVIREAASRQGQYFFTLRLRVEGQDASSPSKEAPHKAEKVSPVKDTSVHRGNRGAHQHNFNKKQTNATYLRGTGIPDHTLH